MILLQSHFVFFLFSTPQFPIWTPNCPQLSNLPHLGLPWKLPRVIFRSIVLKIIQIILFSKLLFEDEIKFLFRSKILKIVSKNSNKDQRENVDVSSLISVLTQTLTPQRLWRNGLITCFPHERAGFDPCKIQYVGGLCFFSQI